MALSTLLCIQVLTLGAAAARSGEDEGDDPFRFFASARSSPSGGWQVVIVDEHRPFLPPGAPPGTRASQAVGQWVFRTPLGKAGSRPQLLHRREGKDVAEHGNSYATAVVLDDGTTLALRPPFLTQWDPSGKKTEKKLAEIGFGWSTLIGHPLGKSALFIFDPLENEDGKEILFLLDTKTLRLSRAPSLGGIGRFVVHWTEDGKNLFGVESIPGKPPWIERPDRTRIKNESYRLVRVDLKGGKRQAVSDRVWSDGICFGKTAIVWNYKEKGRKGIFWRAKISPPFGPKEVPALKEWEPVISLGGDRFLIRTLDWKRHRIIDLAAFDGKALGSGAGDLTMPKYLGSISYSPLVDRLVFLTEPFTLALADLEGAVKETVRFQK